MIKLIKEYKEGLKIFKCDCGHSFALPKFKKAVKCFYCGNVEVKAQELLAIA